MDLAAIWHSGIVDGPPLTDEGIRSANAEWGVHFPDTLLAMLRMHNGGSLFGSDELYIFPLVPSAVDDAASQVIMSLDYYVARGWLMDEADLSSFRAEVADPNATFILNSDGHQGIALVFSLNDSEEASVIYFDTEVWEFVTLSESYDDWINELTKTADTPEKSFHQQIERGQPFGKPVAKTSADETCDTLHVDARSPQQIFTSLGSTADKLIALLNLIQDPETAMQHRDELRDHTAYLDSWRATLEIADGLDADRLHEMMSIQQFPHARVCGSLMQVRACGPKVYKKFVGGARWTKIAAMN